MNNILRVITIALLIGFVVFATVAAFVTSPATCTGFALASVFCGFTGGICLTATR